VLGLHDRQRGFAAALLDPTLAAPSGLLGPDAESSPKRFAVYRNNVAVALTAALQANFPAVCRIVGEEFFRAMARVYAMSDPPRSPILLGYGAGFAKFIAGFEPVSSLPYLSDVARVERAWTEAYHARDAEAVDPPALAAIPSQRIAETVLAVHPSLRIVRSRFPALTIWRMNLADGVPEPVDLEVGGQDVLLLRPAAGVEVLSMPPGAAEFVTALAQGRSLAEATRAALSADAGFDLSANLVALIGAGAFIGFGLTGAAIGADMTGRGS
jgi:hypothetical protein